MSDTHRSVRNRSLLTLSVSLNVLPLAGLNSRMLSQSLGLLGDVRSSWTLGVMVNQSWYHVTYTCHLDSQRTDHAVPCTQTLFGLVRLHQ